MDGRLLARIRSRARPHPGARASRPHTTWHKEMSVDVSPSTAKSLRARPTRERGRLARIRPGTRKCPWTSAHPQQKACERDPPGSAGVSPAYDPGTRKCPWTSAHPQQKACERDPTRERGRLARIRPGTRKRTVDVSPSTGKSLRAGPHPGARASRPHSTWHKEMSVDSPSTKKATSETPPGSAGVSPAYDLAQGNVRGRQPIHSKKLASETPPGSAGVSPAYGLAIWQRTLQRWDRHTLQGNGAESQAVRRNKDAGETPALPGGCGRDARAPGGGHPLHPSAPFTPLPANPQGTRQTPNPNPVSTRGCGD